MVITPGFGDIDFYAGNFYLRKKMISMEAINFKVYPHDKEQIEAIKTIFKAFKLRFEVEDEIYNPEFVERVLLAKDEIKQGKGIKIASEDLWK